MKNKLTKILVFGLFLFIFFIFFLALNSNKRYNTENLIGEKITDFQLYSLVNEKILSSKNLRKNNYTLINFWASWCAPCKIEHKYLLKLNENKNIKIFGINHKDKKDNAIKFLKDLGNPYDYLAKNNDGKISIKFGVYGIPESILINKKLEIIKKFIGPINDNDYKEIIRIINYK